MTTTTGVLGLTTYDANGADADEIFNSFADDVAGESASNMTKIDTFAGLASLMYMAPGRLSLSSTLAEPTTDLTAQTTLYYTLTGRHGNQLALYNGTNWIAHTISASLSLSLVGLTASTVYDIFIYSNSGTPTLEALAWASSGAGTSARATALTTQNGITTKNGDATRRFIGAIMIDAAGGACSFNVGRRGVSNLYNTKIYPVRTRNTSLSWTYATNTLREQNAGAGQERGEFVLCAAQFILNHILSYTVTGTSVANIQIQLNDPVAVAFVGRVYLANGVPTRFLKVAPNLATAGYNFVTLSERVESGTATIFGTAGSNVDSYIDMEF